MSTKIPGLEGAEFADPGEPKLRLSWSLWGETKTGKSSFGLWSPDPSVIFNIDHRIERVIDDFIDGTTTGNQKVIKEVRLDMPECDPVSRKKDDAALKAASVQWDKFLTAYDKALKSSMVDGGVRSVVVDTGTDLFDIRLLSEFGKLLGIQPWERGGANADFIEIMRRGEKYNANTIWLHYGKEEWKTQKTERGEVSAPTGGYILDGFKKANSAVQIVARTNYVEHKDPRKRFEVQLVRCGVGDSRLNGAKFTSMDWAVWDEADKETPILNYGPYAYISSQIIKGTEPEDWL